MLLGLQMFNRIIYSTVMALIGPERLGSLITPFLLKISKLSLMLGFVSQIHVLMTQNTLVSCTPALPDPASSC